MLECTASIRRSVGVLMLRPDAMSDERASGASSGELMQDAAGDALVQGPLSHRNGTDGSQQGGLISALEEKARSTGLKRGQDVVVDVHATQFGTLPRAIAIVDAELAERTVAIDERTSLVVGASALVASGEGNVYVCTKDGPHVQVAVLGGR